MSKKINFGNSIVTRRLLALLIILSFLIFSLAYLTIPTAQFDLLTESFNRIAVGLSALAAVIFGPTLVSRELEKDRKIKEYLKRYPHDKFGKDWEIIESEDNPPGTYYLFDKKIKTKNHILNMKSIYDLGWHIYLQNSKKIKNDLFLSYKVGDRIRTQGEAGE